MLHYSAVSGGHPKPGIYPLLCFQSNQKLDRECLRPCVGFADVNF